MKILHKLLLASLLSATLLGQAYAQKSIVLSSTTSTEQSGLFGHILPPFEKKTGIQVKVVAVGTGQALDIGRRGDADVVFVHDKVAEEKFVADGFADKRIEVMYNDFILLGPKSDPAKLAGGKDIQVALKKIVGEVSPTNTYLYCYDRLSMGVCEMMEALGFYIDGIIDDNAESIVPTEKLAVKLMSPLALDHKLLQHATIIVCHDNMNVCATVKNRFLNEQKRGLRIVNVTTRDLVGDLAYFKFFKPDCV